MTDAFSGIAGDSVAHAFLGRQGGVSRGLYDSLNCGLGTKDNSDAVRENRARAAAKIGCAPDNLLTLYQMHSAVCVTTDKPFGTSRPQADAMVTATPGLALGILTADCVPVLFSARDGEDRPFIGAAHAGWKGALGGVLENTIAALRDLGATAISATIGPCIGFESYEVGPEFPLPFLEEDTASAAFFRDGHFDLPGYAAQRLRSAGVTDISTAHAADTYARESDFFSYRRSVHRKEPDYGRQLSVIAILEK